MLKKYKNFKITFLKNECHQFYKLNVGERITCLLFTKAVNKITGGKRVSWEKGNIPQMTEIRKHITSVRSNSYQKLGRNSRITEQRMPVGTISE